MLKPKEPMNRKELRHFIGAINCCRDMWVRRSHALAPLSDLTSVKTEWQWGEKQAAAFKAAKKIMAKEVLLAHPDFNKPFVMHADASHCQLGGVISQDGEPTAFHSRKLKDAQTRCTAAERELLSAMETVGVDTGHSSL